MWVSSYSYCFLDWNWGGGKPIALFPGSDVTVFKRETRLSNEQVVIFSRNKIQNWRELLVLLLSLISLTIQPNKKERKTERSRRVIFRKKKNTEKLLSELLFNGARSRNVETLLRKSTFCRGHPHFQIGLITSLNFRLAVLVFGKRPFYLYSYTVRN